MIPKNITLGEQNLYYQKFLELFYIILTAQKMKFSIKDFFNKCNQIRSFLQFPVDLVTFTEEILNGKLHFCAVLKVVYKKSFLKHFANFFEKHHFQCLKACIFSSKGLHGCKPAKVSHSRCFPGILPIFSEHLT